MKDFPIVVERTVRDMIVIQSQAFIERDFTKMPSTLVHETAHKKHFDLGEALSREWNINVYGFNDPIVDLIIKQKIAFGEENFGFLSDYAKKNFLGFKPAKKSTYLMNIRYHKFYHIDSKNSMFKLNFESKNEFKKIQEKHVKRQLDFFPQCLVEDLLKTDILIKNNIINSGVFRPLTNSSWFNFQYLIEDVAESTAYFHAAANLPGSYPNVLNKLKSNWRTQMRLEILREYGFVDEEGFEKLSSKTFLNKYT